MKIFVDIMYICRLDLLFLVLTVTLMFEEVPKGMKYITGVLILTSLLCYSIAGHSLGSETKPGAKYLIPNSSVCVVRYIRPCLCTMAETMSNPSSSNFLKTPRTEMRFSQHSGELGI